MKKEIKTRVFSLLLASVLVLGFLPLVSMAQYPGPDAQEMTLYAGQDMDVGSVYVENDDEYLYVTYQISEDNWYLTETHLHIGESLDDFPLAGRWGNPVPGQFDYSGTHDNVTEYTYEISLDDLEAEAGDELIIAAHALVVEITIETGTLTPELYWTRSSEDDVSYFEGRGAQWALEQGFDIELDPEELVWDGGTEYQNDLRAGENSDISYATWIYDYADGDSHDGYADLRRFQANFDIPEGYEITSGKLESVNEGYDEQIPINDNIYIFVNEDLLFWGGTIVNVEGPTEFEGTDGREAIRGGPEGDRDPSETDGWYIPGTIPDIDVADFSRGENTLDVFAEEFSLWGAMHELELTLDYEETTIHEETAWADGTRFTERGNWGTYFGYTVQEYEGNDEDILEYQTETAWAGDTEGEGSGWWYYYDTSGDMEQTIWAGQDIDVGTVTVSEPDNGEVTITMEFSGDWELQDDDESVKIQGYEDGDLPGSRPAAGQFETYKGDELVITVDSFEYYAIHLDVQLPIE